MKKQEFIEIFTQEYSQDFFCTYNDAFSSLLKEYHNINHEIHDDDIEKIFGSVDAFKTFKKEVLELRANTCIKLISRKILFMQTYSLFDRKFKIFDEFDLDEIDELAKEIYSKLQSN